MKTLILRINFSDRIEPERIADACHVFRTQLDRVLRRTGPGPGGAWGYGRIFVRSVTVSAADSRALDVLRELHRYLRPELYPESERPDDATGRWSCSTVARVSRTLEEALEGDPELRRGLAVLSAPSPASEAR
jgi:hypothetical protein